MPRLLLAAALALPVLVHAAVVNRSGSITGSETWTSNNTYYVDGNLTIDAGGSLTIQAGTVVKFAFTRLTVNGTLSAIGTSGSPIILTSDEDESVGDDVTGGATTPGTGDWQTLRINGTGTATMSFVEVRYGGDENNIVEDGAIYVENGGVFNIDNCVIADSEASGIRMFQANPVIDTCAFNDNTRGGMRMDVNSNPTITSPSFNNNSTNGITVDGGTTIGNTAFDDPDVVYHLQGDYTIAPGHTLTVAAGQVVKMNFVRISVGGAFDVNGTMSQPAIFTSILDDTVGGDTNNDAGATMPIANGQWETVDITGTANVSFAEFRFGGDSNNIVEDAILFVDAGATLNIDNCTIHAAEGWGIRMFQSDPVIDQCVFTDNNIGAMRMDVNSNPTITAPSFMNNGTNGVEVASGTSIGDTFLDDPDVVYRLTGNYTVSAGDTLTIGPGQVLKLNFVRITVDGMLDAQGTSMSPIAITAANDDSFGGDTNNDGGASMPAPTGQWQTIDITGDAILSHIELRWGGDSNNIVEDAIIFVDAGATLSIDNCTVHGAEGWGIQMFQANPMIDQCTFTDNAFGAMRMDVNSNPTITAPTFANNRTNGVEVSGGTTSVNTAFDDPGVVYRLTDDYVVGGGQTFTVAAGQIVKLNFARFDVIGTMNVNGTANAPVILTAAADDTFGGDTNNDGNATAPTGNGDWETIDITGNATMSHVEIHYGGDTNNIVEDAVIHVDSGFLAIDNCLITNAEGFGIRWFASAPQIDRCTLRDNRLAALRSDLISNPTITAPVFDNNGANGLSLEGSTIAVTNFWDDPDVVLIPESNLTLPAGATLTIAAGQVIKPNFSTLTIEGDLQVEGTAAKPVIFTSLSDDSAGGDTNNDGLSGGAPGDWDGIRFNGGTGTIAHAMLHFGGDTFTTFDSSLDVINSGGVFATELTVRQSEGSAVSCSTGGTIQVRNGILAGGTAGIRATNACNFVGVNLTIDGNTTNVDADASSVSLTNTIVSNAGRLGVDATGGADVNLFFSALFNPEASSGEVLGIADPVGSNGNISGDPRFVNATLGDFRLLDDSIAIDAGTSNGAPATDIFGNARFDNILIANTGAGPMPFVDIGAIERQDGIPGVLLPLAENNEAGDRFGSAVSADGNRVAVGIPNVDVDGVDDGQVLIFELNGDRFELAAIINVPPGFFAVNFGAAIDLEGNAVLIGAPGTSAQTAKHLPQAKQGLTAMQAAIFERASRTSWQLKVPMTPIDGNTDDMFGASVALDGSTAVVGAPGDAEVIVGGGAAHVFEVDGSSVADSFKINPIAAVANAGFGTAVAASGNMVAAGAPGDNLQGALSGSVSVYQQVASNLSSLDLTGRVTSSGAGDGDQFGTSVALSGDQLLVGAPMEGSNDAGAAYLFEAGGSVRQLGRLAPDAPAANGHVGMAVALDGGDLVAGAPGMNAGVGAVLRFDLTFRQVERLDGPEGGAGFGMALARRGNVLAVGAPDSNAAEGAAFSQLRDALLQFLDGFE